MNRKILSTILVISLLIAQVFIPTARASQSTKLSPPKTIKTEVIPNRGIKLSWNAVTGADGYSIYLLASGKFVCITDVTQTSFIDDNMLQTGCTYTYKVRAFVLKQQTKVYSAYSNQVSASIPFEAPWYADAEYISSKKIKLSWFSVSRAAGYIVYRATNVNGPYVVVKKTSGTSWINTVPSANTTYYYKVRAYLENGNKAVYGGYSPYAWAKKLPTGAKFLNILFVGNSLTFTSDIPGQLYNLPQHKNTYIKVYRALCPGATLQFISAQFSAGAYEEECKKADIVVFQEYGGGVIESTTASVVQLQKYFKKSTKFYFMPIDLGSQSAYFAQYLELKNVPKVTNFKTAYLTSFLYKTFTLEQFHNPNDFHPNTLYGYACSLVLYCTLFGGDATTLPHAFVNPSVIPGKTKVEKEKSVRIIQQAANSAIGYKR